MKKSTKIISVLILLFTIFAGLGSSMMETAQADTPSNVSVTLHKKKMTALPNLLIENTGTEMTEFSGYDDMPNVEFTVYDVTNQFYTLRAGGTPFGEALEEVATTPDTSEHRGSGTTGANGQISFELAAKSDGKDAIYVFVETGAPSGTTPADNLVLALPMYDANDEVMTEILLYPKNVVEAAGKVTVTKKGTADGTPLPDAEFIVSRELTSGNIEYLAEGTNNTSGLHNWTSVRDDARIFTTLTNGQLVIENLERGTYTLIEIAAPDNASIIDEGETEFTIGEGDDATLAFDVYNDTILVDKKHEGNKTDYNVGDLIPYSITVNIPRGMGYQLPGGGYRHPELIITDTPDTGLHFSAIDEVIVDGDNIYNPSWLSSSNNGFVLTIPASALVAYEGKKLEITYNMFLDENADPDVGYNNKATVHTTELTTEDSSDDVFTGGYKFKKVDANFGENNTLADAEFVVRDADDDDANYLHIHPTTNAVTWVATLVEATVFETEADGLINVAGLEYGTYFLEEIEAPADYVLLEERVLFTVAKGSYTENLRLDVTNIRKGRLPSTGGSGILGIVAIGATLVATTGGYYIKRKREE